MEAESGRVFERVRKETHKKRQTEQEEEEIVFMGQDTTLWFLETLLASFLA